MDRSFRQPHKLEVSELSYNWQGFQTWATLQDGIDVGSIDKVETSFQWQKFFLSVPRYYWCAPMSQPASCISLWIMDCHSRPAKKSTSHGIELLMQDTAHLIQRPCYQRGIHAKIQQAIGPQEDLTIIKRRKLKWYSHVSHSSGLAKAIFQGTVKGGRRQGRQKKRWKDIIREWTGLEFVPNPRGQCSIEKNGGNWLWSHL